MKKKNRFEVVSLLVVLIIDKIINIKVSAPSDIRLLYEYDENKSPTDL